MFVRHRRPLALAVSAVITGAALVVPNSLAWADEDPQPTPSAGEPVVEPVVPEPAVEPSAPTVDPLPDAAKGDEPEREPPKGRQPAPEPEPDIKGAPPSRDGGNSGIDKEKAQAAAQAAVDEARSAYEKALAKHRVSKFEIQQLRERADRAGARAAELRRDLGNLARMAYSAGNRDMNLFALVLDSETPQELLSGAETAERLADHRDAQLADTVVLQRKADVLAEEARTLAEVTKRELTEAKADLDAALALADSVDLAIEPPVKTPPVDLTTKSDWVFPSGEGEISSEAGPRMHPILHYVRCHEGADITASSGTPIYAVDDGVVLQAGVNGGYGNYTLIAHGSGVTSGYAHQETLLVKPGDRVARGQLIGKVGTTGLSSGPHLHFEARYYGKAYNPRGWLEDQPELRVPAC